jgi:hypothetical protein
VEENKKENEEEKEGEEETVYEEAARAKRCEKSAAVWAHPMACA